jgi:hypothetical protein
MPYIIWTYAKEYGSIGNHFYTTRVRFIWK